MKLSLFIIAIFSLLLSCKEQQESSKKNNSEKEIIQVPERKFPFVWEAANIYFLLTDRFNNGNTQNDTTLNRINPAAVLRGFMGGDISGITQKINEGYFTELGVNAIWFTPVVEQIHGSTDESTGNTYGYHGYWAKDWTALDPNFGTKEELTTMVKTAHSKGIRVIMDVVLNHTGPVTEEDPVWPSDWVRTDPTCQFSTYENTTSCTLVDNLPDIYTESDTAVELPDSLLSKWKSEGRLANELEELDAFFKRTGYSRNPRAYITKWLTDYVYELGIDAYRVDTVKHADEKAWAELFNEASYAFEAWKQNNPNSVLDESAFHMFGEVYNYGISGGREFDFGDKKVDYFNYGFNSLINFELKYDANNDYETTFTKYDSLLNTKLKGKGVVNYLTSHDDGQPFDKDRTQSFKTANVLLLTPGASQIYYGDESARDLTIEGTQGDATLRSFMNWDDIEKTDSTKAILAHWRKLGQFRDKHPAIGVGQHKIISESPYVFSRTYSQGNLKDQVVVGLDLPKGIKSLSVKGIFEDGTKLYDTYSDTVVVVKDSKVLLDNDNDISLLELVE